MFQSSHWEETVVESKRKGKVAVLMVPYRDKVTSKPSHPDMQATLFKTSESRASKSVWKLWGAGPFTES